MNVTSRNRLKLYPSCPSFIRCLQHRAVSLRQHGFLVCFSLYLCVLYVDVCMDWSDHALWWPDKNFWLLRTRSTLDQYGVQADCRLVFTTMHKNVRVLLPDLQDVDVRVNFSADVFAVVVKLCKEFGQSAVFENMALIREDNIYL